MYCLAVQAGIYRDGIVLASDVRGNKLNPWPGQNVFSIFSPGCYRIKKTSELKFESN